MRRGPILTAAVTFLAVLALSATSALAASPRQIYADLAQHGKLTKHYSPADLKRAMQDAMVQGYVPVGPKPPVLSGAKPSVKTNGPAPAVRKSGTLPFTGFQLSVFAILGLALLGGGFLLHRAGRGNARS
jgi:hypothetical protein